MRSQLLHEQDGRKIFAVVFDKNDEVMCGLTAFAKQERLGASQVTAIGAFAEATLGYFDRQARGYQTIPVQEQVEVLSLIGDITLNQGEPSAHLHAVVGKRDGTTLGGHLLEGRVWPTLEVIVSESPPTCRNATIPRLASRSSRSRRPFLNVDSASHLLFYANRWTDRLSTFPPGIEVAAGSKRTTCRAPWQSQRTGRWLARPQ
jgi:predicted DNA-binding protein with PD1-like motif